MGTPKVGKHGSRIKGAALAEMLLYFPAAPSCSRVLYSERSFTERIMHRKRQIYETRNPLQPFHALARAPTAT
jgi:hypothetical protein